MKETKITITQELIDRSRVWNVENCIGANALRDVLAEQGMYLKIYWGDRVGAYILNGASNYVAAFKVAKKASWLSKLFGGGVDRVEPYSMMDAQVGDEVILREVDKEEYSSRGY